MKIETGNWLKQAQKDADVARTLCKIKKYVHSSFWCQQAAEKALKALLLEKEQELIKTQDLVWLAKSLEAPENVVQLWKKLKPVYMETRNPGVGMEGVREFTKKETEEDVKTMGGILRWIKESL